MSMKTTDTIQTNNSNSVREFLSVTTEKLCGVSLTPDHLFERVVLWEPQKTQ